MLEGQAGEGGLRFNLGEMLVTRCVVSLSHEEHGIRQGYAYIQGNRPEHATAAAVCDALMQLPDYAALLTRLLLIPLHQEKLRQKDVQSQKTAETKVDFFTMVRGEDE